MRNDVVNESRVLKVFETLIKNEKDDEKKIQHSQVRRGQGPGVGGRGQGPGASDSPCFDLFVWLKFLDRQ